MTSEKRTNTGVRLAVLMGVFALVVAVNAASPAEAVAPPQPDPLAAHGESLMVSLAEAEPIEWESMAPVKDWVAEQERLERERIAKERSAQLAKERAAYIASQPQKQNVVRQSSETTPTAVTGKKVAWTYAQIRARLEKSCDRYGVTGADRTWIVTAGTKVASRESGGRWWVINSSGHAGLFQFANAWGQLKYRLDPNWSCDRFVKVYVDGGKAKIRQHWKATLGGM